MPLKPLVFVPGFPGSKLFDIRRDERIYPPKLPIKNKTNLLTRLNGPEDPTKFDGVISLGPIDSQFKIGIFDFFEEAENLYKILDRIGYEIFRGKKKFIPVGWDWRLPINHPTTVTRLEYAINQLFTDNQKKKVVAIVHSTGGLVLRSLLESKPDLIDKLEHIIAFGVPWGGTLKPLHRAMIGKKMRFPINKILSKEEMKAILKHAHAMYDLLPPERANGATKVPDLFFDKSSQANSPLVKTSWIPSGAVNKFMRDRAANSRARLGKRRAGFRFNLKKLPVTNIVGWGKSTHTKCQLTANNTLSFSSTVEGDGTIPAISAEWIGGKNVKTIYLPHQVFEGHGNLWEAKPSRKILAEILASGSAQTEHIYLGFIRENKKYRILVVAQDKDGKPLRDVTAKLPQIDDRTYDFVRPERRSIPVERRKLPGPLNSPVQLTVEISWQDGGNKVTRKRKIWIRK